MNRTSSFKNRIVISLAPGRPLPHLRTGRASLNDFDQTIDVEGKGLNEHAAGATFLKQLRPSAIADCQLPDVMRDSDGNIRKPSAW